MISSCFVDFSERLNFIQNLCQDRAFISTVDRLYILICNAISNGNTIYIAGNGGSASQSQHFAAEVIGRLKKMRRPYPVVSLASDISAITCVGNDFGYEHIFARQLIACAKKGDIFIALTTSGKSKNVIEALSVCKEIGVSTITICGNDTIDLAPICENIISIPTCDNVMVQEITLVLLHLFAQRIEDNLIDSDKLKSWEKVLQFAKQGFKNLLLDRDGVINTLIPNGYVCKWNDFKFDPYFQLVCRDLAKNFSQIIVVTNQKCIGKGLLSMSTLNEIHSKMMDSIKSHGGRIDGIYVCGDSDSHSKMLKPGIGMAEQIKEDYADFDFSKSVMVGDTAVDMIFAKRIGAEFVNIAY